MAFLVFLTLFYHLLTIIVSLFACKHSGIIIFQRSFFTRAVSFSPLILIYFIYILVCNFLSTLNCIYLIIFWRPEDNIYDARILYWLGIIPWLQFFSQSLIETCLCVDRCFTIIFPISYDSRKKKYFAYCCVVWLLVGLTLITKVNNLLDVIPENSVSPCRYVGCFINASIAKYLLYTKIAITIPNIFCGFVLIILIHKIFKNHNNNKNIIRISKTVYFIIAITAAFDFVPVFVADIFKGITGLSLVTLLGPYGITLNACCCSICVGIYSKAFQKIGNNSSAVISPQVIISPQIAIK